MKEKPESPTQNTKHKKIRSMSSSVATSLLCLALLAVVAFSCSSSVAVNAEHVCDKIQFSNGSIVDLSDTNPMWHGFLNRFDVSDGSDLGRTNANKIQWTFSLCDKKKFPKPQKKKCPGGGSFLSKEKCAVRFKNMLATPEADNENSRVVFKYMSTSSNLEWEAHVFSYCGKSSDIVVKDNQYFSRTDSTQPGRFYMNFTISSKIFCAVNPNTDL